MTQTMKKTEYQVNKEGRLWQVTHKHNYPNHTMDHAVYIGPSWEFCMWLATGDPFYVLLFDELVYGQISTQCGARVTSYHIKMIGLRTR